MSPPKLLRSKVFQGHSIKFWPGLKGSPKNFLRGWVCEADRIIARGTMTGRPGMTTHGGGGAS